MKLYFAPGACSLSPHIVLEEAGLEYTTEQVDLGKKVTASGQDFTAVNPKGYVPVLEMHGGAILTEGPAIVQYLADLAPDSRLAPPAGSAERYQLMSMLNFISTELHKNFGPLFNPEASADMKAAARANLAKRYAYMAGLLAEQDYVCGAQFSVADAYLFTVTNWTAKLGVDLSPWPAVQAFQARVGARPAVLRAMRAEGLIQ